MGKAKDLVAGVHGYLDSTLKTDSNSNAVHSNKPEEKEVPIHFTCSPALKKRMDLYCVKADLKKRAFLTKILEEFLNAHE